MVVMSKSVIFRAAGKLEIDKGYMWTHNHTDGMWFVYMIPD